VCATGAGPHSNPPVLAFVAAAEHGGFQWDSRSEFASGGAPRTAGPGKPTERGVASDPATLGGLLST
jgi:hypothetical protein